MRLTCLKCGNQMELGEVSSSGAALSRVNCVCGEDYTYPRVINTGVQPDERAAERSRYRAFRAAGVVKNLGGFALGIAALGVLFPPFGLVGAAMGIYVLTMLRGPVSRFSGRRYAIFAVALGITVSVAGGVLVAHFLDQRRMREIQKAQSMATQDLRSLLRAERLFRASTDTYGTLGEFAFSPQYSRYTIYLGFDDWAAAKVEGEEVVDPLPEGLRPGVSENAFTAVAVSNLDSDAALDVWLLYDNGEVTHLVDDLVAE